MATILVVQDSMSIRMLVKFVLEQAGFAVDFAVTGEDALERMKKKGFDLVLLDYGLPGINGGEVCRIYKQEPDARPVIFMSAKKDSEMTAIVKETGADGYISESFSPESLIGEVFRYLKQG